jgi:hypothetical protein
MFDVRGASHQQRIEKKQNHVRNTLHNPFR